MGNGQLLFVQFANTTLHTTPPFSVGVFKQDGGLLDSGTVAPVPPGGIGSFEYEESTNDDLYVIANFASPTNGQAIPNPLPITAVVYLSDGTPAVFTPAR
jgi:hypothetical protein